MTGLLLGTRAEDGHKGEERRDDLIIGWNGNEPWGFTTVSSFHHMGRQTNGGSPP